MSDNNGALVSSISYMPFGSTRSGSVPTDIKFTGQRLDGTGLYYYGARYYDPEIGRFISPDTVVPDLRNPQSLNRYSYVLNNPLKFIDPTGQIVEGVATPEELLATEEAGMPVSYEAYELALDWQEMMKAEPDYTQYMIDSDIVFNITDIDLPTKTISFLTDSLPGITFKEPAQLRFVDEGLTPMFVTMKYLLRDTPATSLYPGPIHMRTDVPTTTGGFTQLVAHESYHRWEQSQGSFMIWYIEYGLESLLGLLPHDLRASEIRANDYARHYFPLK